MSFQSWLLFCVTETVLCFTPGPAVLLVVSLSITRGPAAGLTASLGILSANAMYFVVSATSLGALLLASGELFTVVKWIGAAYLIWRGITMIAASRKALPQDHIDSGLVRGKPRLGSFPYGFLTQAANPKALIFFSAILPQFIDPQRAVGVQLAILGVSSILIELAVLGIYVLASHRTRGFVQNSRVAAPFEAAAGVLLIGAGAQLARSHPG
jgi:homoserine/homoserine lactone efflux protein